MQLITIVTVFYLVALSSALENVQEQWKDRFSSVLKDIEDMPRPSVWENKGMMVIEPKELSNEKTVEGLDPEGSNTCEQQTCGGENKRFGDIGYALMGYNILKGYPLATGKDPGFVQSIFMADYSDNQFTADRVHHVPKGITAIPDVSCMTSFSSKVIKSQDDLTKSLAVSASAHGSGWGVSFSASADYQHNVHTMSSGEFVYINSEARCMYYFTTLDPVNPPKVHSSFEEEINELIKSPVDNNFHKFFDTYGTHFARSMNFGAKFVYEHKMNSTSFKKEEKSKFGVKVSASYSGLFSAGASFSLDKDQQEAASRFNKMTETKTITVGAAPPSNGDALTWASTVKDSPMPMEYQLVSIEELLSNTYLPKIKSDTLANLKEKLIAAKPKYCQYLVEKGEAQDCHSEISIQNAANYEQFALQVCNPGEKDSDLETHFEVKTTNDCLDLCEKSAQCTAAIYNAPWNSCMLKKYCFQFIERENHYTYRKRNWLPDLKGAYEIFEGRDCPGTNLFSYENVPDVDTCVSYCHIDSSCIGVLYRPIAKICATKTTCTTKEIMDYDVDMYLKGSGNGVYLDNWSRLKYIKCNGNTLGTADQPRLDFTGCLDLCNRSPGCKAVSWQMSDKLCTLKTSCSSSADNAYDSYVRQPNLGAIQNPLFFIYSPRGDYELTYDEAAKQCNDEGGRLATKSQVVAAYNAGLDYCSCGWIEEGYATFPIVYPRRGCFATVRMQREMNYS